ncbi:MAG TPA: hypothetical protein VNT53_09710 [Pseudolysinimonas sp.]|nr:hypothetical protein [Pseudolysinimonas sp.]
MSTQTLATWLAQYETPVHALRKVANFPLENIGPGGEGEYLPEHSNWRLEQRAWRESVALLDLSFHMTILRLKGPDALRLLEDNSVNNWEGFEIGNAKQIVSITPDGWMLGEGIVHKKAEDSYELTPDLALFDWLRFQIEKGGYDVEYSSYYPGVTTPERYRFEVQGPDAFKLLAKVTDADLEAVKFFHGLDFEIAGHKVHGIRHGMAGQPGLEFEGPWEERHEVRQIIVDAGEEFGLRQVGYFAYFTASIDSGYTWVKIPAIYSGEAMREFREWVELPEDPEAFGMVSMGGSYDPANIEDYYFTPYDLGFGRTVSKRRDFRGKAALEKNVADRKARTKVTLVWDADSFAEATKGLVTPVDGLTTLPISPLIANYAGAQLDAVQHDGKTVGVAWQSGFMASDKVFATVAIVDEEFGEPGTELTLLWGDSRVFPRQDLEEHRQFPIKVTVAPAPWASYARDGYRSDLAGASVS